MRDHRPIHATAAGSALLLFLLLSAFITSTATAQSVKRTPGKAATERVEKAPESGEGVAGLEPPALVTKTDITYPENAPPHDGPITVRVKLRVGPDGKVAKAEPLGTTHPIFENQVLRAVRTFGFRPARYKGKPVTVEIAYAHTFLPPAKPEPKPIAAKGPELDCRIEGRLREKGTRIPIARVLIAAVVQGRRYTTTSNTKGRFKLRLPAGRVRLSVHGAGYLDFLQIERLSHDQTLKVAYLVERERYDPYEIVVYGDQRRTEISRTTLRGREMTQVPGTFGDPFRVIQTLPGVASVVGLLPFPIVRGSSPGNTGFLIDRIRVPLLFHLLAGPSVIHPDFLEEVHFYPGGFPVQYGGYTAGIIDGQTRRARPDEKLIDVNLNLVQTGGLVRWPVPALGGTVTAAGRIGYPGILLSLATDDASLNYWDYQLRFDAGTTRNGFTIFAFGAADEVKGLPDGADSTDPTVELETVLRLAFHRLDLRYLKRHGKIDAVYRLTGGIDDTIAGGSTGVRTLLAQPFLTWTYRHDPSLKVIVGAEGSAKDTQQQQGLAADDNEPQLDAFTEDLKRFYTASAWTEAHWRPRDDLFFRPGIRFDVRADEATTKAAADPRLLARWRVYTPGLAADVTETSRDDQSVWVKGAVGLYHQPPRFFLPLPGLDQMPLRYGLLAALQTSLGVEAPLAHGLSLDASVFYNDMDPVIFDLNVNAALEDVQLSGPDTLPGVLPPEPEPGNQNVQAALDRLFQAQVGRAYGFELMVRRRSRTGIYGWLSYTLSLSERFKNDAWAPFDFDRTHLINLVAGLPLPRNWEVGGRLQFQSGKPATTTSGYNAARTDGYMRIDVRIDKRAVWNKWLLDFYVDITNVVLFPEEVAPGSIIRYVLPTVGFRARL